MAARPRSKAPERGDETRAALLRSATTVFARDGYHAASTRAIAHGAGFNQALIGYHFGGKDGLYLAVFEQIAQRMERQTEPIAVEIGDAPGPDPGRSTGAERKRHLERLHRLVAALVALLTLDETADWARLILREQQSPSAAFELLYERVMGRVLGMLRRLVAGIRGTDPDAVDTRLTAFTIVGQVLVFRVAHAAVLRQLGWKKVGPAQVAQIQDRIRRNIDSLLDGGSPP
jgi:AcrR family transcriptional regulator